MVRYDRLLRRRGVGQLFFSNLEGEVTINLPENFLTDYLARNIEPLEQFGDELVPAPEYAICLVTTPFINVKSGFENYPFGSTPETRYKLGSYSSIAGYSNSVTSEGNLISIPYLSQPSFLIYPQTKCNRTYSLFRRDSLIVAEYQVDQESTPLADNEEVLLQLPRELFRTIPSDNPCAEFVLNLNSGLIADITFAYEYSIFIRTIDLDFGNYWYNL